MLLGWTGLLTIGYIRFRRRETQGDIAIIKRC